MIPTQPEILIGSIRTLRTLVTLTRQIRPAVGSTIMNQVLQAFGPHDSGGIGKGLIEEGVDV